MGITDIYNTVNQLQNQTNKTQFELNRQNMGTNQIGKDAFLQLLLTQLQHQDPIEPVDNKEFITQQAMFTQIEKLDKINDTLDRSNYMAQVSSLVGKTVDIAQEGGDIVTGRINSIDFYQDSISLRIGDQEFSPSQITKIYAEHPGE